MSAKYAAETTVPVEKTRHEIEVTLKRYKADAFGYATDSGGAMIFFQLAGRRIKFILPLPDRASKEITHAHMGVRGIQPRSDAAAEAAYDKAARQRWRALLLIIKAKLEAVASGITTIEDEFLAQTVLPDGQTVSQAMQPQIEQAYSDGKMPPLMLQGPR